MNTKALPLMTIHDHPCGSQWRYRFYNKDTKKWVYKVVRYGKRNTKEQAYTIICKAREQALIDYAEKWR